MKASKLTTKFQATVPKPVREFLGLEKGDAVSFEIEDDQVVLKKIQAIDLEWHRSLNQTMSEWNSKEDNEAYENL
jgi:antitoxin PrlF